MRFFERDIPTSLTSFTDEVALCFRGFRGAAYVSGDIQLPDPIDDLRVAQLDTLPSEYGRYYFKRDGVWKGFYVPYAKSPGVYFFFDDDGVGIYVGATVRSIGGRVKDHVGAMTGCGEFPHLEFPEATYVLCLPFDRAPFPKAPFLAKAFESYLLSKYDFQNPRTT